MRGRRDAARNHFEVYLRESEEDSLENLIKLDATCHAIDAWRLELVNFRVWLSRSLANCLM
jgi:hypothetical protein